MDKKNRKFHVFEPMLDITLTLARELELKAPLYIISFRILILLIPGISNGTRKSLKGQKENDEKYTHGFRIRFRMRAGFVGAKKLLLFPRHQLFFLCIRNSGK
ncbi:hypothetical protein TorRG33x02_336370 [Trema orientale]|uniref:Uncharacterized protein n=1 Tax=Trema orientale TaxID=63057 RepID=A0A2P5B046_TREOI|nr:hypothetical protein TorRG33x02_336370 [Trema orientale]